MEETAAGTGSEAQPTTQGRRANRVATLVFLLWLVAAFLPWWSATNVTGDATNRYGLWDHPSPDVDIRGSWVWVTDALALVPVSLLFLRIAARSIVHEPRSWRRDVAVSAVAMALALASVALWPVEEPFWGATHFQADEASEPQEIFAMPGNGWFLGALCLLLLAWAWWSTRPAANGK